jgi:uncharacterized Tic20 family protein
MTLGKEVNENIEGDTTLAAVAHLSSFLFYMIGPFAVLVPILLLIFYQDDELVTESAKNVIDWQLSFIILTILSFVLIFVLIGFLLIPTLIILSFLLPPVGAVKALSGKVWVYPYSFSFVGDNY